MNKEFIQTKRYVDGKCVSSKKGKTVSFGWKTNENVKLNSVVYDGCVIVEGKKLWMIDIFTLEVRGTMKFITKSLHKKDENYLFYFPFLDADQRKKNWIDAISTAQNENGSQIISDLVQIIADYLTGFYGVGNSFYCIDE